MGILFLGVALNILIYQIKKHIGTNQYAYINTMVPEDGLEPS